MNNKRLLIVGAGLAGSMVAYLAARQNWEPLVFDSREEWAASPASSNLSMPSWVARLGVAGQEGLKALERDWPVRRISFNQGQTEAIHLHMDDVLWRNPIPQRVINVEDGRIETKDGSRFSGTVVVAAGVWCRELLPSLPKIKALAGHSLIFQGHWPEPILRLWAPYRHLKVFQWHEDRIWFGDSTAVLQKNYRPVDAELASLRRARSIGLRGSHITLRGLRPVLEDCAVYYQRLGEHLWVLTGGGKMGMTVYAGAALHIVEELDR